MTSIETATLAKDTDYLEALKPLGEELDELKKFRAEDFTAAFNPEIDFTPFMDGEATSKDGESDDTDDTDYEGPTASAEIHEKLAKDIALPLRVRGDDGVGHPTVSEVPSLGVCRAHGGRLGSTCSEKEDPSSEKRQVQQGRSFSCPRICSIHWEAEYVISSKHVGYRLHSEE